MKTLLARYDGNRTLRWIIPLAVALIAALILAMSVLSPSPAGASILDPLANQAATPAAPTGLAAAAGDAQVTLTWNNPNDATITGYQFRQRKGSGNWGDWTDITPSDATTVTHTVTSLENDANYRFRVRAVSTGGEGVQSSVARATPTAAAATATPTPTPAPVPTTATLDFLTGRVGTLSPSTGDIPTFGDVDNENSDGNTLLGWFDAREADPEKADPGEATPRCLEVAFEQTHIYITYSWGGAGTKAVVNLPKRENGVSGWYHDIGYFAGAGLIHQFFYADTGEGDSELSRERWTRTVAELEGRSTTGSAVNEVGYWDGPSIGLPGLVEITHDDLIEVYFTVPEASSLPVDVTLEAKNSNLKDTTYTITLARDCAALIAATPTPVPTDATLDFLTGRASASGPQTTDKPPVGDPDDETGDTNALLGWFDVKDITPIKADPGETIPRCLEVPASQSYIYIAYSWGAHGTKAVVNLPIRGGGIQGWYEPWGGTPNVGYHYFVEHGDISQYSYRPNTKGLFGSRTEYDRPGGDVPPTAINFWDGNPRGNGAWTHNDVLEVVFKAPEGSPPSRWT